jgi:ribosomal protein L29
MAISEAARNDLYNGLRDVLGPERAETLMSAVPLHDLDEVATKGDLAELRADLRAEMSELRAEFKSELAQLRVEMTTEIGALRQTMTNWMLTVLVTVVGAMVGIALIA